MEELTYIPQPSITISQNIVTITSLAPVKFTIDGSDPIYYGLLYTGPFSINSVTVIKAVAFNENYVSEMAVGSFSPETDVVDGASGSEWTPSSGDGITIEELSAMSYATTSYVADYVTTYGGNVDLSSYVTYDFLSAQSYLTSIPSEYITQTELSACGYITASDIPSIPVIDENIIPKENNTYMLGDADHIYRYAYIQTLRGLGTGLSLLLGADPKYDFYGSSFRPRTNGNINLGGDQYKWAATYSYIYKLGYNTSISSDSDYGIQTTINGHKNFQWNLYQFSMIDNNYRDLCSLGTSGTPWAYTYSSNIYTNKVFLNEDKVYLYSNGVGQLKFAVNGADRFRINYNTFESSISGETSLGRSDNPFTNSYITNLYTSYIAQNTYVASYQGLFIGTDRPWYLYGTGGKGNEAVQLKASTSGKYFNIKDYYNNDIIRIYEVNSSGNWIQIPAKINSNIIPNISASYTLGSADSRWKEVRAKTTYTDNIYLGNTDINEKFIPTEGGTVTGRLESTYYTTVNYLGGISSYSSVLVGADDRNSVTMLATRRLCGDTSYAAAFFTNSDGRSKFTHKTKTTDTTALGSNDDAFLCFNAYGFKLAYSGTPGTSATTEYDLIHSGNIDNYLATSYSLGKVHFGTAVTSSTSSTAVCTVTVDTFELDSNNKPLSGTQIAFKVTSATSVNGVAMKLNVNSTGNISMYYDNAVVTSTTRNWYRDCTRVNGWYYFIFDGTYWVWQNCSSENNNTYSTMTDANMQAGTETSGRLVTAKQLATYYTAKSCFSFDSSTNTLTITTT